MGAVVAARGPASPACDCGASPGRRGCADEGCGCGAPAGGCGCARGAKAVPEGKADALRPQRPPRLAPPTAARRGDGPRQAQRASASLMRRPIAQARLRSLALVFAVACSAEPKRPGVSDTGGSLIEAGDALIGVWRSKAPPSGGDWTDEGCRLTEWIECDLVEFVIEGWREVVPQEELEASDRPVDDDAFRGSLIRNRCAVEWSQGQAAEVSRRRGYGSDVSLHFRDGAFDLEFSGFFPMVPEEPSPQEIVCEHSSADQIDCGWPVDRELYFGDYPTDRLVLERVDAADQTLLCDELFERYLLSPRGTAPWNER
jgi:hypothetical protein